MYKHGTFWVSACRSHRETTKVNNCTVKGIVSEFPFQFFHVARFRAHSKRQNWPPRQVLKRVFLKSFSLKTVVHIIVKDQRLTLTFCLIVEFSLRLD